MEGSFSFDGMENVPVTMYKMKRKEKRESEREEDRRGERETCTKYISSIYVMQVLVSKKIFTINSIMKIVAVLLCLAAFQQ